MNTPGNYPPVTTGKHGLAVFIRRYLPIGPFYPAGIGPFLPTNVGPYHPTLTFPYLWLWRTISKAQIYELMRNGFVTAGETQIVSSYS